MKMFFYATLGVLSMVLSGCEQTVIDDANPSIDMSFADAFPKNCDVIKRGNTFILKALLTDNVELGSFSIDIHNNFNHHSHSTDVSQCSFDAKKTAINPWVFIAEYSIDRGLREFVAEVAIDIPADIDPGDYHLMISLTDHAGWNALKGISIKIE